MGAKPARNPLNQESLRRDLTDPQRLQILMDHLGELLREEPALQDLRLPPEKLLDALDDLAEAAGDELRAMDDPFRQRITILNRTLQPLLTRKFVNRFEKGLIAYMETVKRIPRHFRALSAGLYFLEIHNRQGGEPGVNPLWNLLFDISYEEAMATAGGALTATDTPSDTAKTPSRNNVADASSIPVSAASMLSETADEISGETIALIRETVQSIESGQVVLGFALDTILLGLREVTASDNPPPETLAAALQTAFQKEIGVQAYNDLVWGLEYAVDQLDGDKKNDFTRLLNAVRALPPRENPVMFALYYKSVTEFYKYLKPGEIEHAEAIAASGVDVESILAFARYLLLEREVPRRALNAFIAATDIDPSHETARLGAGIACWMTESFREARMHWDRAARLWRGYLPEDHKDVRLARALAELENFAELPQNAYDRLFEASDREETL